MKRGFSLPEVLVVMFLSGTVLSLIAALLLPSLWMWRVESARGEAQQGGGQGGQQQGAHGGFPLVKAASDGPPGQTARRAGQAG